MNTPQATEYVYTWYEPEASYEQGHWRAHRVLKQTEKFIYVDFGYGGAWHETRKLYRDREEEGRIWWRSGSHTGGEAFYTEAGKKALDLCRESYRYIPECLKALGLTEDATAADVKRAYHELCLKEHPDTGGTHEGFLKLQEHYEIALRIVRHV